MARQTLPHHIGIPLAIAIVSDSVEAFVWFMPERWGGHPELLSSLYVITLAWTGLCMVRLGQAFWWQRRWTRNQVWQVGPTTLPMLAPRPQQGLYLGEGFRWNARHTQRLEQALAIDGALPVAQDAQGGHPALHGIGHQDVEPCVIPWSELAAQMLITGSTRSGKTTLLEVLVEDAIRSKPPGGGGAVVILDPKDNRDLLARVAAAAARAGRPFRLIAAAFPHDSNTLNIVSTATTPDEVAARLHPLMPSRGRPTAGAFFEQYCLTFLGTLVEAMNALGQPLSLQRLAQVSTLRDPFAELLLAYLGHLGIPTGRGLSTAIGQYRVRPKRDTLADTLLKYYDQDAKHFEEITATLLPTFRGLVNDDLGSVFSAVPSDLTWRQIAEQGMVVYIALGTLLLGETANRLGRLVLQDLMGYLGWRYAYTEVRKAPPITIVIDELKQVLYPAFTSTLAMSGGAGARFILAQQSFADAREALGAAAADVMMDNINTKVYCRLADDTGGQATASQVSTSLDFCYVQKPEERLGVAYGGPGGLSGGAGQQQREVKTNLVRASWLRALPRGHFFATMKGEVWKGRVPLLTPVSEATIAELGLRDLWDQLDPYVKREGEAP